jgi:hypothetical protein
MGKRLAVVLGAVTVAVAVSAAPALAAPTDSSTVTFGIDAGTLDITVPASTDLGSGSPGDTVTAQMGAVTVSDERAELVGTWTATVTSTTFTTGGGTPDETIPAGAVSYWSGEATATTGVGGAIPGQLTALLAAPLSPTTPVTAFSKLEGAGNNSATWNPSLVVSVPAAAVAGTYTGTVTQSVA